MAKEHGLLIVDDEKDIVDQLYDYFRRDYDVHKAYNCQEALGIIKENEVHLVMTDQRMPQMLGTELLAILKKDNPQITRILMTGYTDLEVAIEAINEGSIHRYLSKPLNFEELADIIKEGIGCYMKAVEVKNIIAQEKEDIIGKIKNVFSQIKVVETDKGKLEKELQAAKDIESRFQKEMEEKINELQKEREAAVSEVMDLKEKVAKVLDNLDIAQKEAEKTNQLKEENIVMQKEIKEIESKFSLVNKSASSLKDEIVQLKQERDSAQAEKDRMEKKLKQFQKNWGKAMV